MYTDRGAASSQCEPQFDTYPSRSCVAGARGLNPRIWPATACIRVRQEGKDIHILRVRRQLSDRGTGERGRDSGQMQSSCFSGWLARTRCGSGLVAGA